MSAVAARARALVGARFRLHGRDPATGLDCVGLAACAAGVDRVPSGYPLRGGDPEAVAAVIDALGIGRAIGDARAGDIILCASGPGQLHLAIDGGGSVIHADAMLRRVVERPGPVPWRVLARWRTRNEAEV